MIISQTRNERAQPMIFRIVTWYNTYMPTSVLRSLVVCSLKRVLQKIYSIGALRNVLIILFV